MLDTNTFELELVKCLISLTDDQIKNIDINTNEFGMPYQLIMDVALYNFLISRHIFIKSVNCLNNAKKGINIFEFSDEDLMYMKLMGWLE